MEADLLAFWRRLDEPMNVALAVSGGSDSMALLALAAKTLLPRNVQLTAISIDHGSAYRSAGTKLPWFKKQRSALQIPTVIARWDGVKTSNRIDGSGPH